MSPLFRYGCTCRVPPSSGSRYCCARRDLRKVRGSFSPLQRACLPVSNEDQHRRALLCVCTQSGRSTRSVERIDDVNARLVLCIARDNESNVLSAPDSQEGASQRDPCNPDVYDKFRGVCAHDNSVRCTRTTIFHLRARSRDARPAYCRGGCCSSGRGVLNDARRSSENLAAPLDRYASLNQSLSSGRNEPMYWRPGSTFIHSTRRSREVT